MHLFHCLRTLAIRVVAISIASVCTPLVGTAAAQDARENLENTVLVVPTRRAPDAPPAPPPELPPSAEHVRPLSFEVVIRRRPQTGRERTTTHEVSRTKDRMHLVAGRKEWLFERNPVDPRRVTAWLVDHDAREIVLHEESEVRNMLGLTGWADVLTLGFDATALGRLTPARESRSMGGVSFRKYTASDTNHGIREVWWNEAQALPGEFVTRDAGGTTRVTINRLETSVDPALLSSPSLRFRDYTVVDLAEWLEKH